MAGPENKETPDIFTAQLKAAKALQVGGDNQGSADLYRVMTGWFGRRPEALIAMEIPLRMLGLHTEALANVEEGIALAKELHLDGLANGIDVLRTGNRAKDGFPPGQDFAQAQVFVEQAKDLMATMPDASLAKVNAYTNIGLFYNDKDILPEALNAYQQAETNARELVSKEPNNIEFQNRLARTLHTKGVTQERLGNYDEAKASQDEAYPIFEKLGDARNLCNVLASKGNLSVIGGRNIEAQNYWEQGLEIAKKIKDETYIKVFTDQLTQLQTPPTQG